MSKKKISIIDYGIGNILSLSRAIEFNGYKVNLVNRPEDIILSEKLILPGVGAFKNGMEKIKKKNFLQPIIEASKKGTPILGICLGMQMLAEESQEFGKTKGFSLIKGKIKLMKLDKFNKVPHIGWEKIFKNKEIHSGIPILKNDRFYFVHSYYFDCQKKKEIVGQVKYGNKLITAIVRKGNIFGYQFHPEKSGKSGLKVLKYFLEL